MIHREGQPVAIRRRRRIRVPYEHLAELWRDIRYGLRARAGSPGFTAVTLISLSLGISIASCALSEMNGMVLRTLSGVPKPEELVGLQLPTSYPNYKAYRAQSDLFSSTFAYVAPVPFGVSLGERTERTGTPGHALVLLHAGCASSLGPLL